MDLESLRAGIQNSKVRVRITQHARIEAFKDGLTVADLRHALMDGEVIEEYPERDRLLLLATTPVPQMPCHIVLESLTSDVATIVTSYIPGDDEWHRNYKTRK